MSASFSALGLTFATSSSSLATLGAAALQGDEAGWYGAIGRLGQVSAPAEQIGQLVLGNAMEDGGEAGQTRKLQVARGDKGRRRARVVAWRLGRRQGCVPVAEEREVQLQRPQRGREVDQGGGYSRSTCVESAHLRQRLAARRGCGQNKYSRGTEFRRIPRGSQNGKWWCRTGCTMSRSHQHARKSAKRVGIPAKVPEKHWRWSQRKSKISVQSSTGRSANIGGGCGKRGMAVGCRLSPGGAPLLLAVASMVCIPSFLGFVSCIMTCLLRRIWIQLECIMRDKVLDQWENLDEMWKLA
jgi:hypothetical protein